jgi:hypothetical protein
LVALHPKSGTIRRAQRVGEALSCRYEIPQELPREMLALLMQLNAQHEE